MDGKVIEDDSHAFDRSSPSTTIGVLLLYAL